MNSPIAGLSWSYWRRLKSGFFVLATSVTIVAIIWIGANWNPDRANLLLMFCGCGWIVAAGSPAVVEQHHLNLPVSVKQLVTVLSGCAVLVVIAFYATTALVMNFILDAQWMLLKPAVFLGGLMLLALAFVQAFDLHQENLIVVAFLAAIGFGFFTPTDDGAIWKLHPFLQWLMLGTMTLGGWRLQVWAVDRQRRGAVSLSEAFVRWNKSLEVRRREYRGRFASASHAVFALDWLPSRSAILVGSIVFAMAFTIIPVWVDITLIGVPLFVYACAPVFGFFITCEFMSADDKSNGDFRWTLPISDQSMARGLMRLLGTALVVWWAAGLVCFCTVAMWLHFTGQLSVAVDDSLAGFNGNSLGLFCAGVACAVSPLLIGWITTTVGLQSSIQDGCTSRLHGIVYALLVLTAIVNNWWFDHAAHWIIWQAVAAFFGLMLLAGSAKSFRYAIGWRLINAKSANWLAVTWAISAIAGTAGLVSVGHAGPGNLILLAGITSLVFKPLAAIPLAVMARRHFC